MPAYTMSKRLLFVTAMVGTHFSAYAGMTVYDLNDVVRFRLQDVSFFTVFLMLFGLGVLASSAVLISPRSRKKLTKFVQRARIEPPAKDKDPVRDVIDEVRKVTGIPRTGWVTEEPVSVPTLRHRKPVIPVPSSIDDINRDAVETLAVRSLGSSRPANWQHGKHPPRSISAGVTP
jgi:hypothetical protein